MTETKTTYEDSLYTLILHYNKQASDDTAGAILTKLQEVAKSTFTYMINKSTRGAVNGFIARADVLHAVASACWISLTGDGFLDEFSQWCVKKQAQNAASQQDEDISSLFNRFVGNLAARMIYRLSRDEFSEFYSMCGRKRSVQYLEDMKTQISSSPLFAAPKRRSTGVAVSAEQGDEYQEPSGILDENNSFIMQAFAMIENSGYRNVLYRFDIKGIPLIEIAAEMKMDYSVIRQWHKRALGELKKNLDKILSGRWGNHYFKSVNEIRGSYSKMGEPFTLRLRLLETDAGGIAFKDALDTLIKDGTFPVPEDLALNFTENSSFDEIVECIRTFPFMDDRLLQDAHFRESLYIELRKKRSKNEIVRYLFLQALKFQHQQLLWSIYETFRESVEMSPVNRVQVPNTGN